MKNVGARAYKRESTRIHVVCHGPSGDDILSHQDRK